MYPEYSQRILPYVSMKTLPKLAGLEFPFEAPSKSSLTKPMGGGGSRGIGDRGWRLDANIDVPWFHVQHGGYH
jgi:hypothetical protein